VFQLRPMSRRKEDFLGRCGVFKVERLISFQCFLPLHPSSVLQ